MVIMVRLESCVYNESAESALCLGAAIVGVVTETNAEKAIEELKAYEVCCHHLVSLLLPSNPHELSSTQSKAL